AARYQPKPLEIAYSDFLAAHGVDPRRAIMFDDLEKNLRVPHAIGMATVQVVAGAGFAHEQCDAWELGRGDAHVHVHHVTDDLAAFLKLCRTSRARISCRSILYRLSGPFSLLPALP